MDKERELKAIILAELTQLPPKLRHKHLVWLSEHWNDKSPEAVLEKCITLIHQSKITFAWSCDQSPN